MINQTNEVKTTAQPMDEAQLGEHPSGVASHCSDAEVWWGPELGRGPAHASPTKLPYIPFTSPEG